MGTPIDKSPAGDRCSVCWGAGKPFGSGATPRYVSLCFTGILPNTEYFVDPPSPFNGVYVLEQTASACFYSLLHADYTISCRFNSGGTDIGIWLTGYDPSYASYGLPCSLLGDNVFIVDSRRIWYSGTVQVTLGFE